MPPYPCLRTFIAFAGGFTLGQLYYFYLLKKIPFPGDIGLIISLALSLLMGLGNAVCVQIRCAYLLSLPMYCGKPGRGVLKLVVLTYVIAGPITNMGLNAKEVVRVFACSTQLAHNLSEAKRELLSAPFRQTMLGLRPEISQIKDTISSIEEVIAPIETEIEDYSPHHSVLYNNVKRSTRKRSGFSTTEVRDEDFYQKYYMEKLEEQCRKQMSCAVAVCTDIFSSCHPQCLDSVPRHSSWVLCKPLKLCHICDINRVLEEINLCDSKNQSNPGLGEGYVALKKAKRILADNRDVALQYKANVVRELYDFQDAKETGDSVMHAFEEKYIIMHCMTIAVNVFVALLFLKIFYAAVVYHDEYLTDIEHDNVYITSHFKRIDRKRLRRDQYTLLPLKKMERSKYVDVHSLAYMWTDRNKLVTHILKLLLEVVTATTFVMLDRLFYEALDVVRQHAEMELPKEGTRDLGIEVDGTGILANMVRKIVNSLNVEDKTGWTASNTLCLPRPRLIPSSFYLKIYGGYLWILFLLYINPYTTRLRRWVCSYFYPNREKQRILHLYNDILKKRMKMQKTLRRKAIQAVRAHYLTGENLLSLRIKFPRLLGWLRVLPSARMTCLICGETEPRNHEQAEQSSEHWHSCTMSKCPFVYCVECWREAGARCLACAPSLAQLSDVDSLSDDEFRQ